MPAQVNAMGSLLTSEAQGQTPGAPDSRSYDPASLEAPALTGTWNLGFPLWV